MGAVRDERAARGYMQGRGTTVGEGEHGWQGQNGFLVSQKLENL